ncbi:MAG: recombinase family protein [Anaerolineales bacterium]|nr:MAG: recombinase family protein [Anaerolineales bacterium]
MDRAAIYTRVSTDEQTEGYSLEAQVEQCQRYCEQKGYAVSRVYREDFTGTSANRPAINEMLADHQAYDVVVVYQVDRLSRSRTAMVVIEMELERLKKRTEFVVGNFDTTPEGNLFKNLMVDFAQFDRENLLRRTSSGRTNRVRAGNVTVGRALFGYNYVSEGRVGKYAINEDEAKWVRQIFEWYLGGMSLFGIAKKLTAEQVPSRADKKGWRKKTQYATWYDSSVVRILRNPAYYGEWAYGRQGPRVIVNVPAIVSKDVWEAAGRQIANNRRMGRRNTKYPYLMRGRLKCAHCGYHFVAIQRNPRGKNIQRRYRCKGTIGSPLHGWEKICRGEPSTEAVDAAVWDFVVRAISQPELTAEAMRQKHELVRQSTVQLQAAIDTLGRQLEKLDERRVRLLDLYADQKIPKEDLEGLVAENVREAKSARERLDDLKSALGESPPDPEMAREFLEKYRDGLEEATLGERERIVAELGLTGLVSKDRKTVTVRGDFLEGIVALP